ncbi:MAG: hypothetical protein GY868_19505, partial [Deltaproteobacteria bacterium]|nr:hypothetical protein [Deltaproteobacteria bacterium]
MNDQGGYVLVLSLFMMVLLSMIGLAALMTGTTDIDIAGNDKFHLMAFYEAESGLNIAAEIIQQLNGYDSAADVVDSEGYFDDNGTIRIHDLDFLQEPREVGSNVVWDKQAQNEWIEARTRGVAGHGSIKLLAAGSQPDIEVGG